ATKKMVDQLQKQMDTIMQTLSRLEHDMFMQQKQPEPVRQPDFHSFDQQPFQQQSFSQQSFQQPDLPPLSGGPLPPNDFSLPPLEPNGLGKKKKGIGSFFKK